MIAANRDEYYDRPAEGPALRGEPGRSVVAPRDVRAGGTWLGVNRDGVFAAVTNLRADSPDPTRRSRGLVVMDVLREPRAARGADLLKALPERAYNPFQCYVADAEQAFLLVYRDVPRLFPLAPGVHVVGNVDPSAEPAPKVDRVRAAVESVVARAEDRHEELLRGLASVCREHETGGGGVADTCVHLGAYGTRSSALLVLADSREASRLLFADGAPCEVDYEDHSPLLRAQSQTAGDRSGEQAARIAS